MKITGYRQLTTVHDWGRPVGDVNGVIASGVTDVPIILVETDVGITGVGLGAHPAIETVFSAIEGEDPRAVTALYDRMLRSVFKSGHAGAVFGTIGALDMALWDIKAKAAKEPLWRLLGARDRVVPGYASGLDAGLDDAQLVSLYERFAGAGFRAAKLKGGADAARDIRRFELVAHVFAGHGVEHPSLMLDVNESWNRAQGTRYLARLEAQLDLAWIEEPVRRWDAAGHAAIRRLTRAAVASGENLTGIEQFRPLLTAGAVDIVQTGSVWGITHFLRVAALAHAFDLPVSPVAYDANPLAAAAASVPNCLAIEVQDLGMPVGLDVDQRYEHGAVILGDRPGIGIVVDERAITVSERVGAWAVPGGPHARSAHAGLGLAIEGGNDVS
ncbi:mandelate racemase/muconate lactonizing enzyme family protein [Rathayibacter soli]|uniref:mandelate racemase/muconate lactonizing enzyme family protein n=1 Tax=Rathayibacter soli TaxID=3144168 RepID=UPI0027E4B6BD|nr:mandelate racemase/muconate lactonizing enzyme family protein [Glaciibacter superstes]